MAAFDQKNVLRLAWDKPQTIATIEIDFDTDFDHPMESVLMGHPERDMPFCVSDLTVTTGDGKQVLGTISGNHKSQRTLRLESPVTTDSLELHVQRPSGQVPAALFAVRCYPSE